MIPEDAQPDDFSSSPQSKSTTASETEPANDPLTEDLALALLKRPDLLAQDIEHLAKNSALLKSRKVRLALAAHPRAPRRLALRLLRELYTFDLMHFSQIPTAPADLKRTADEFLITRLASISLGERISLARRCSVTVATALLHDKESRVWQTALENPRLTETAVTRALQRPGATPGFVEAVSHHAKWSPRPEIRLALLRNPHTPLARAIEFARRLRPAQLRDVLHTSRLPEKIKQYLRKNLQTKT
jgi:hypothetical protein